MQLDNALKDVAVIGACGKMGKGIASLLLQEIARTEMSLTGNTGQYSLHLIDANLEAFPELKNYLKGQLTKFAEKNIALLRNYCSKDLKLVSNKDIIEKYVDGALASVYFSTSLDSVAHSSLVFEAIVEDLDSKVDLFKKLRQIQKTPKFIFTNTSSIPIHVLDLLGDLDGRIIGFHFYNPPIVQNLIELIPLQKGDPELKTLSEELVKRLNKKAIYSNDIAGFIGNGYFMQEINYACEKAREFGQIHSDAEGVYLIDTVTKDFLLRPMGIFQLMDFVGIDVCARILKVMQQQLPQKKLHDPLIDEMLLSGKTGGQMPDGTLKEGFFQYEGLERKAIYSVEKKMYLPLDQLENKVKEHLGDFPDPAVTWKKLQNSSKKEEILLSYFNKMKQSQSLGSELGVKFLNHSNKIAKDLVLDGVASSLDDVDQILKNGFYHLYGVIR